MLGLRRFILQLDGGGGVKIAAFAKVDVAELVGEAGGGADGGADVAVGVAVYPGAGAAACD